MDRELWTTLQSVRIFAVLSTVAFETTQVSHEAPRDAPQGPPHHNRHARAAVPT